MRKYKTLITDFSVVEDNILTQEEANKKEIFYIAKFDSFKNGYNSAAGGDNGFQKKGEEHPQAKLSDLQVLEIRKIRASKLYTMEEVFNFYSDIMSYSGFEKIWTYQTRTDVAPELDIPELREFYRIDKRKLVGEGHFNSKLTNDEVIRCRNDYWVEGIPIKTIYENFKDKYSLSGFKKIINGYTYKNLPMPKCTNKCTKRKKNMTKEQVLFIRDKYNKGYKIMEIIRTWFPDISESVISSIISRRTYKNY